jgi:hypothetical protein
MDDVAIPELRVSRAPFHASSLHCVDPAHPPVARTEATQAVNAGWRWRRRPDGRRAIPQLVTALSGCAWPRHLDIAFDLLTELGTAANFTTDVQLGALAIEHRTKMCSNDTDFGRFPRFSVGQSASLTRTSRFGALRAPSAVLAARDGTAPSAGTAYVLPGQLRMPRSNRR